MFTMTPMFQRKRERQDEDLAPLGFGEHRVKRHMSGLPLRQSPPKQRSLSPLSMHLPGPTTITPEDSPVQAVYNAAPPSPMMMPSPTIAISRDSPDMEDSDMDMDDADSMLLSPGPFQADPATSISGRIPTPIHTSFATNVRRSPHNPKLPPHLSLSSRVTGLLEVRGDGMSRRLPSPISEGENSPSVIVRGMGEMQVQTPRVEQTSMKPPSREISGSRHSFRNWGNADVHSPGATGARKSFSVGYRADCEKCRNHVPGHFSHIITHEQ